MVDADTARAILQTPAEDYDNDETLSMMWATKAFEHAEIYFNMLCSVDPKLLKLSSWDQSIYAAFRKDFPDMKIDVLDENEMKNASGKVKWREFCERFKEIVDDYNFGTLLRINCLQEYTESNSMFATRIQFLAIEIARNLEGYNDPIRLKFRRDKNDCTNE